MVRQFDASRVRPRCLSYDAVGENLAVAFTSGIVKILDAASLDDVTTFKNSKDPCVACKFFGVNPIRWIVSFMRRSLQTPSFVIAHQR